MVDIIVMVKGSGYRPVSLEPKMVADIAGEISRYGSTVIHLKSGTALEVAGFYMAGKKAGDRVIILSDDDKR